jgi:competence protein ComGC
MLIPRLEASTKNLSSLQEHFDSTHEQLSTSIDLLKRAGIVNDDGTYDESVIEAIEGQKEKYESEIEDLQTSLGEAAEEIKK